MTDRTPSFGPWPYGHNVTDMFLDVGTGEINFDYFRAFFDRVSLPFDVAKACLGSHYSQYRQPVSVEFAKFVKLSTLRAKDRIPTYQEIKGDLVDYRDIPKFKIVGALKAFGGEDFLSVTPCIFVSHRWQTPDHPDPDGARLQLILKRLDPVVSHEGAATEIYLWLDFCCLPQRRGTDPLCRADLDSLRAGLGRLAEVVKSCDLLVLDSPDYSGRAWCFAELFVWLSKLAEVNYADAFEGSGVARSILTRHLFDGVHGRSDAHHFDQSVVENLRCRGYSGSSTDILEIYRPIRDHHQTTVDSANYTMGAFESEYFPTLVGFMCNSWHMLRQKDCTDRDDRELCLRIIVDALKSFGVLSG
ncbi:MAG TPA: hypothetical protein VGK44_18050 [Casimicrobiaceae bacterium]|jgi:hypothetical protein